VKYENEKKREKERERIFGGRGTKEYSESDFLKDKLNRD
jgi:hypothetical protein